MHATYATHHILFTLITLLYAEKYQLNLSAKNRLIII
jgi:hypothetical protein